MAPRSRALLEGFARNLRQLMDSRELSVADLGERAELSPRRINLLLEAKVEPGALEIMRLAAALEVGPDDLLCGLD